MSFKLPSSQTSLGLYIWVIHGQLKKYGVSFGAEQPGVIQTPWRGWHKAVAAGATVPREIHHHGQAPNAPTPLTGPHQGRAGRREQQPRARKIDYMLYWI